MPRFFFYVRYANGVVVPDSEGIEFPDLALAIADTLMGIAQTIQEQPTTGKPIPRVAIEIFDEGGRLLRTIPFDTPRR